MVIRPAPFNFWKQVLEHLPPEFDLERTARERRAFVRARAVKDAATLLQLAMAYGGCGMSLRDVCAWAAATELAELTDPSLIDRLCNAAPWLGDIVAAMVRRKVAVPAKRWSGYRLRALDATALCQPGADRTTWRVHVGYDLATRQVDQIELTDGRGGENLQRLSYQPGEIVLGDRIYARARNLLQVKQEGADFMVRTGWNSLSWKHPDGSELDLFATLRAQRRQTSEIRVRVGDAKEGLEARLVVWRKSFEQAQVERERLLKNAKKRGTSVDPRSLEAAEYVMLLTSLPLNVFPASDVLAIYRFRWQIELAFKRMKSLAGLDELAAKKPELARAWIYARLIVFLMAEQRAGQVSEPPPCGPRKRRIRSKSHAKPLTLAAHEICPYRRPRQHPRTTALATAPRRAKQSPPALV
jgi:DDE family transposase